MFNCYSGTLKKLDNLIIPNPIFFDFYCYPTFNAGFNDTKYEMLTICFRSKQKRSELSGGIIVSYRSPYLLGKNTPRSLYFPVNNYWEYFIRGVLVYCDTGTSYLWNLIFFSIPLLKPKCWVFQKFQYIQQNIKYFKYFVRNI